MKFLYTIIIISICLVTLAAAGYFYIWYQMNHPLDQAGQMKEFVIRPGQGAQEIGLNLENQGLIRSRFWFLTYVWLTDKKAELKAGTYQLSPSQSIAEIVALVTIMPTAKTEIKITFAEGLKTEQIVNKLTEQKLTDKDALLEEINNLEKYRPEYMFLADLPDAANLDGFLFPDTYRFYQDSQAEVIIKKMLDNFDKKLTAEMRQDIASQNKTIFEIIVLASIIEKEVVSDKDRALVAGIFWQRLEDEYPLESCATIAYALGIDKWRYSDLDLEVKSPYNTYKNIGLPPGPISNPGLSAIKAAIYAQESDYYYFLSTPEGETIFSKTHEEHIANKAKYFK